MSVYDDCIKKIINVKNVVNKLFLVIGQSNSPLQKKKTH
jgi:hypothetical protein